MSINPVYFRLNKPFYIDQCVCVWGGGGGGEEGVQISHLPCFAFAASARFCGFLPLLLFDPHKIKYCQVISPTSCHFGTPISQPFSPNSLIWLPSLIPLGSCLPFLLQYHLLLVQQLKSLVATYVLVCSIDQSTTKWTVSLCGCTDCTTANLFDGKFIIYR